MPRYTTTQIEQQYQKLSSPLKHAMMSAEIAEKMFAIGEQQGLDRDQISFLSEETGYVVLGLTHPRTFMPSIMARLNIDEQFAGVLAREIHKIILQPLHDALKLTHQINVDDLLPIPPSLGATVHLTDAEKSEQPSPESKIPQYPYPPTNPPPAPYPLTSQASPPQSLPAPAIPHATPPPHLALAEETSPPTQNQEEIIARAIAQDLISLSNENLAIAQEEIKKLKQKQQDISEVRLREMIEKTAEIVFGAKIAPLVRQEMQRAIPREMQGVKSALAEEIHALIPQPQSDEQLLSHIEIALTKFNLPLMIQQEVKRAASAMRNQTLELLRNELQKLHRPERNAPDQRSHRQKADHSSQPVKPPQSSPSRPPSSAKEEQPPQPQPTSPEPSPSIPSYRSKVPTLDLRNNPTISSHPLPRTPPPPPLHEKATPPQSSSPPQQENDYSGFDPYREKIE
ncbi:MAG: hypothetical protein G01um101466_719 [Parcubacteria group bacterium Gr01-1014_66]|nr:MAG: hypothetical protein G01um101466_719 [Parcubacteria group bacterium Gr01-1014_66]